MTGPAHSYAVTVEWTGNRGRGTAGYTSYDRTHEIRVAGKAVIAGSSDPAFRGDPALHNPEELLVASLSACHMLWYLHLCSDAKLIVTGYTDAAAGTMVEVDGVVRFDDVVLRPVVTLASGSRANDDTMNATVHAAERLHERAHALCFIANSVNFPVRCEPQTRIE